MQVKLMIVLHTTLVGWNTVTQLTFQYSNGLEKWLKRPVFAIAFLS